MIEHQLATYDRRFVQRKLGEELLPSVKTTQAKIESAKWNLRLPTPERDCDVDSLLSYCSIKLPTLFPIGVLRLPFDADIEQWVKLDQKRDSDLDIVGILIEIHNGNKMLSELSPSLIPKLSSFNHLDLLDSFDESYHLSQTRPFSAFCVAICRIVRSQTSSLSANSSVPPHSVIGFASNSSEMWRSLKDLQHPLVSDIYKI